MFDDPAVRSVRVALALCDRFAELTKGPTTISASKQRGALVGVSGNDSELSLRISEAQQLYPEIWRHLDEARATFAGRGVALSVFDRIRTQESGIGVAVEVTDESFGFGSHGVDKTTKSAAFNLEGLARARRGIVAITEATPDIPWAEIAAAEAADPAAAAFARAQRSKRYLRLAALVLVIASPFLIVMYMRHRERAKREAWRERATQVQAPNSEELARITATVKELQPVIARARAGWATEFAAIASVVPSEQPCPALPQLPGNGNAYVTKGVVPGAFTATDFYAFPVGQPVIDEALAEAQRSITAAEAAVRDGRATHLNARALAAITRRILVVIIDRDVAPVVADGAFTSGNVVGRGFLFDVRAARIVCTGPIDVSNAPDDREHRAHYTLAHQPEVARAMLHRELELHIRKALATTLRAR